MVVGLALRRLFVQHINDVVSTSDREPLIARHHASAVPASETQQVPVGHLPGALSLPQFDHDGWKLRLAETNDRD
jgi:hypothetical protein